MDSKRKLKSKIIKFFKNILVAVIATMIAFSIPENTMNVSAASGDLQGFLNGHVYSGFTNKVANPKYNDNASNIENIDPIAGTVSLRQSDISLPGREGLDLEIARQYNSAAAEPMKKKAGYAFSEYYVIYDEPWQFYNGQWNAAPKTARPKFYSLTEAENEYERLFLFYMELEECIDYEITNSYFEVLFNTGVVWRHYAPKYEYTEQKWSELELKNYNVERYDLGVGWSFAFPSIELAEGGYMYYHDGNGGAYRMISNGSNSYSLENYDAKDINIYSLNETDGINYYVNYNTVINYCFNSNGTIKKIYDRFGNRIKFEYVNRPVYNKVSPTYSANNQKPFIKKITDSVGRVIDFEYENKIDSGAHWTLDLLTLYVTDPITKIKKKLIEYQKRGIRAGYDVNGIMQYEFNYPVLDRVKKYTDDTNSMFTQFEYDVQMAAFNFWTKNATFNSGFLLLKKHYNDIAATNFVYEKVAQNLGNDGLCYEARCKQRYENLHDRIYLDTATNTWKWLTQRLNQKDFEYSAMSYTGYPNYLSESLVPDNTEIWSVQKEPNGTNTKTVHLINNTVKRKRLYKIRNTSADGSYMDTINDVFDTRFPSKPTVTDRSYFDKNGAFYGQGYYVYKTYNDWGALESETQPIHYASWNNEDYKNKRKVTYEYEPNYRLLKKKTWWKDDATQLYEQNNYDAFGRLGISRNAKGELTYYNYEVVNATYPGESTYSVVTKQTTRKSLGNGKEAKSEIYFDIDKGSLPVKTINYFSEDAGSKQITVTMAYDMLLGLLKTKTEQGNTTTYDYDLLGREKSIVYPSYTDVDGKTYSVTENYNYTPGYSLEYRELPTESFDGKDYNGIYGLTVESETVYKCNDVETKYNQKRCLYDTYGNLRLEKNYDFKTGRWIQSTKNIFDNVPRLTATIDTNNNKTSCNYDVNGDMSEIIDPYGNIYVTEAVRHDFITDYFVPANKVQLYRQDPHYTNANVKFLRETYFDTSERVEKRIQYKGENRQNPIWESYKYDIAGNVIGYIDPKSNCNEDNLTNRYYYDALNRLIKVKNALNQIVDINYNLSGEIDSVYAKDNDTTTVKTEIYKKIYTETGKLNTKTVGTEIKSNSLYNELGLVSRMKFKNLNTTDYYYDQLNKVKKMDIFNSTASSVLQRVSYLNNNPFGHSEIRTSDNTLNGSLTDKITIGYNYDTQISSKQVDYSINSVTKSILASSIYNDMGLKTKSNIAGFGSNYYTNYFFDKTRIEKVQLDGNDTANSNDSVCAKFSYNDAGIVDTVQYPVCINGEYVKTKYLYTTLGKIQTVTNTLGTKVLSQESYEYDNNGNITKITQAVSNGPSTITTTTDYTYDKLDRLWTEKIVSGTSTTNNTYNYDLLGNRIAPAATYNITVNEKEKVVSIPNIGGSTSAYKYGQDGLRYQKTFNNKTYSYSYDTNGNLLQVNDGTSTDSFSWANGKVYAKKDGKTNKTYYYLYNGLGDVTQLVDSSGNIINTYSYDAWGKPVLKQETISNPFRYRGYIFDDETGLYYLKARYYDCAYGRFITEDTYEGEVINLQSLNLYTYCENNPVNGWDPTGHKVQWKQGGSLAAGFIAGGISEVWNGSFGIFQVWDNINAMKDLISGIASGDIGWEQLKQMGFDTVAGDLKYVYDNRNILFDDKYYSNATINNYGKRLAGAYSEVMNIGATAFGAAKTASSIVRKLRGIGCFTAGTLVFTRDGQKPIEGVKVGDYVWSENPETGEKGLKKVVKTFIHDKYTLIHVYVGDELIETTEEHPFWVESKGWIAASELQKGDLLRLKSNVNKEVTKLELIDLRESVKVYNFEVEDWHTYFVSGTGVLVHNMCMKILPGDKTPNGYIMTKHAAEHAMERGFSLQRIDNIISKWSHKYYSYGEEIYAQVNGNYYDLVIKSRSTNNIVSVIGGKTNSLKTTKDIEKFFKNSGQTITTVPLD